jgi:tubulin--tyrosine ligase
MNIVQNISVLLDVFQQKAQNGDYCPKLIIAPTTKQHGDSEEDEENTGSCQNIPEGVDFQFAEYERIDWHNVFVTKKMGASSYFVRKGISRKAQLAMYTSQYVQTKNPKSILKQAMPKTIVIETWDAFDHSNDRLHNIEYGNTSIANIELERQVTKSKSMTSSIKDKLMNSCLEEVINEMQLAEEVYQTGQYRRIKGRNTYLDLPPVWILKPSTVNKGEGIKILHCVEEVLDAVMEDCNIREWYVEIFFKILLSICPSLQIP